MAKHKLVVTQEHIKSQQDDDIYYSNLPWNAQLNCDCDWMAGSICKCQQSMDASPNSSTPQAGHIAPLAIDGTFSSSHIASAIKEAIFHSDFIKYVIHQSWWLDSTIFNLTDWERQELVPASTHCMAINLQSLNLNLHYLLLYLPVTGWKRQLTIDVQDARSFRKLLPMCFSLHIAPLFVHQLGLRLFIPLRKHPHVHSLLQLLVMVFHNGL